MSDPRVAALLACLRSTGACVLMTTFKGQTIAAVLPPSSAIAGWSHDVLIAGAELLEQKAREMRQVADMSVAELFAADAPRGQA